MNKNKKMLAVLSVPALASLLAVAVTTPVKAANRDFYDISTTPVTTFANADYNEKDDVLNNLILATMDHPTKLVYEFGGKYYNYDTLSNNYNTAKAKDGATAATAFTASLANTTDVPNPVPAPDTKLAVSSVSAINVKQIQVTFTTKVDKATAETVGNYLNNGVALPAAPGATPVAKLQADGKTVVITLGVTPLVNQSTNNLTVSGVKDTAGNVITATTTKFTVVDTAIPQALSATLVSPAQVKVKFSAPVISGSSMEYLLDNGQYSIATVTADPSDDSALLTLSTALPAGAHTLVVAPNSSYAPQAYNLYKVATTSLSLTATADTTAPVASISNVSLADAAHTTVQFKFSKPVALNGAGFYWGYNKVAANAGATPVVDSSATTYTIGATTYADTYNVTFNTVIPTGANTFYIDNDADVNSTTNYIVDTWGNKFQSTSLTGSLTADTTKPTVSKAVLNSTSASQDKIDITFTKAVSNATTGTNYVLKDSTGAVVTPATFSGSVDYSGHPTGLIDNTLVSTSGYYEINLGAKLPAGTYTLTVSGVQDAAYPAHNTMDTQTYTLTVVDTSAPSVTKVTKSGDGTKLFVYYTKAMAVAGTGSILDTANYQFNSSALPTGTTITTTNGNTVAVINFPSAQTTFTNLAVGAVKDSLGNTISGLASPTNVISADSMSSSDIVAGTATATAKDTITFEVAQPLSGVYAGGMHVNGALVSSATYVNKTISNGKYGALVTVKASAAYASSDSAAYSVVVDNGALTNANGAVFTAMSPATSYTITGIVDKVSPLIATATVNDTTASVTIPSTSADGKNLVIDLSTVAPTHLLNGVTINASEASTISVPLFTLNGVTVPGQTLTTNASGSVIINLASLAGIGDNGNNGVTESKLKQLAGASDTITLPATLIDKAGNTTTGSITIKGLK